MGYVSWVAEGQKSQSPHILYDKIFLLHILNVENLSEKVIHIYCWPPLHIFKTKIGHYMNKPLFKYIEGSHCVEWENGHAHKVRNTVQYRWYFHSIRQINTTTPSKMKTRSSTKSSKDDYPSKKRAVASQTRTLGGSGDILEDTISCLQHCFGSLAKSSIW